MAKPNKKSAWMEVAAGLGLIAVAVVIYHYYPSEVVFPVLVVAMGCVALYWGGKALFSD